MSPVLYDKYKLLYNLNKIKQTMYRTTNFQSSNFLSRPSGNFYSGTNYDPTCLDIKDSNLKIAMNNLIKNNQDLNDKLNVQKQKNFELMELKRRMQEDIKRLEFELDRMGTYESLSSREIEIKRNQIVNDNNKLQNQLDDYLQENKKMRGQMRKWMNECEQLSREKQDLVNQNVILLGQIAQLKTKLSFSQAQIKQYQKMIGKYRDSLQNVKTVRSQNNESSNRNSKQYITSMVYQSPPPRHQLHAQQDHGYRHINNTKQEVSTNPSENKISLASPGEFRSNRQAFGRVEKIFQDFYEDAQPSPRSFSNKLIQQNLQPFLIGSNNQIRNTSINPNYSSQNNVQAIKKSPDVLSYANRQSPAIQMLRFNQLQTPMAPSQNEGSGRIYLQTYQKRQLKDQVSSLRNQLVNDLIDKYYRGCLELAEEQKSNSLKIFMKELSPKINTLQQMVMNYMQARSMLAQSCPTLRLRWQPINPHTNNSGLNMHNPESASQLISKNTFYISNIFESIKQNARKQKNIAGQYLALFRLLTLLNKVEKQVDPLLIDNVKHSALKQIHRIKQCTQGKLGQADDE